MEMDTYVYANTYRKRTSQRTNRLDTCTCRAQRLYVQLLPKSMLIATMYSNRLWDKVFSCHILQDTQIIMSISGKFSEHKGFRPLFDDRNFIPRLLFKDMY